MHALQQMTQWRKGFRASHSTAALLPRTREAPKKTSFRTIMFISAAALRLFKPGLAL